MKLSTSARSLRLIRHGGSCVYTSTKPRIAIFMHKKVITVMEHNVSLGSLSLVLLKVCTEIGGPFLLWLTSEVQSIFNALSSSLAASCFCRSSCTDHLLAKLGYLEGGGYPRYRLGQSAV